MKELEENEVVTYGNIKITATCDEDYSDVLKIETTKGDLVIKTKDVDVITVESTM